MLFQSWGFYRAQLMREAAVYGWPVARHMILAFPNNSRVYQEELTQQFMLGTSLLIAPVLSEGRTNASVFLPAGSNWSWLWGSPDTVLKGKSPSLSLKLKLVGHKKAFYPSKIEGPNFTRDYPIKCMLIVMS